MCTQLDQVKGRSLTEQGKEIARRWIWWNVFDVDDCIFICCIRKAIGNGIAVTKMSYMQCMLGTEINCPHEVACAKVLAEAENINVNESGDLQETWNETDDEYSDMDESSNIEYSASDLFHVNWK